MQLVQTTLKLIVPIAIFEKSATSATVTCVAKLILAVPVLIFENGAASATTTCVANSDICSSNSDLQKIATPLLLPLMQPIIMAK